MRRAARRDSNEAEIVKALVKAGGYVIRLNGAAVPDLACYMRGVWYLLDCKVKRGKLTERQTWAEDISPDAVKIVRSVEQALDAVGVL